MFFRRQKPTVATFEEKLQSLRQAGFEVAAAAAGKATVQRDACAVTVRETQGGNAALDTPGIVVANEIALLTDLGYQKVFTTPSGVRMPALAVQLRALHDFTEDLRAALGIDSLYNESLGTVN
jgi:hypothetical protein